MMNEMKVASALGAKTARACDSCLRIRARWFCAADDAFLCHACDNLVHSANQLASKHERVKLQSSSSKVNNALTPNKVTTTQTWHSGFTRKARTPRSHNNKHLVVQQQQPKNEEQEKVIFSDNTSTTFPLVPELGSEESSLLDYESEDHVLFRVPVLDPFDSELCNIYNEEEAFDLGNFPEFLPLDIDLAEIAADVESLLGNGHGEDSGLELLDCKEEDGIDHANVGVRANKGAMVKVKDEEEEKVVVPVVASGGADKVGTKKERFLRLNYEEVIAAWASQGSPWTTENPSKFNFDDCWPHFLGSSGADDQCSYREVRSLRGYPIGSSADGGREARVSRYREKRRTRLFSKKIRYEVRKLNAENRPRMKGRFVKRASFVGTTAFPA